jgi:predicted MFS family arabinose efflux permease
MKPRSPTGRDWRRPELLLILISVAMPISFSTWMALINNFAVERAQFTGVEIGILQSVREIPGFLSFAVIFVLLLLREQALALLSLGLLGIGVALTGFFPNFVGLLLTTVVMSTGFHYFETVRQSLALQWLAKEQAPAMLGRLIAVGSFASLVAFALIYLGIDLGGLDMKWVYLIGGAITVVLTLAAWLLFPRFPEKVEQRKRLILRRRYGLYYALTFMAGARRQIFVVFAGFLMVEKFGFDVASMTLMLLANHVIAMVLAPRIGKLVGRWGERTMLTIEYVGLIVVFTAYAFVETAWIAVGLYILDHLFFAMAIAIKTYFQKIADPADIAATSGVSFTINHIAAVVIPAAFGLLWMVSPAAVFLAGTGMAVCSLVLARLVPRQPTYDNVTVLRRPIAVAAE